MKFPDPARSAEAAAATLRRQGIAVRRFASPAYSDCIRVTLGRRAELQAAERAIAAFVQGEG